MKCKKKDLGLLKGLTHQRIPRSFGTKKIFQIKYFAKAVQEQLQLLNETELETGKNIDESFDEYAGFLISDHFERSKLDSEFHHEMKPTYEQEIEIEDFPSFKLDDWKSLEVSGAELDRLCELGIIIEE